MLTPLYLLLCSGPYGDLAVVVTVFLLIRISMLIAKQATQTRLCRFTVLGLVPLVFGIIGCMDGHMIVARQLAAAVNDPAAIAMIQAGSVEANYPLYIGMVGSTLVCALAGVGSMLASQTAD